ncbi:MAG: hypothetical protein SOT28_11600 [Fusicatenibacter sp.]|nr:hypothetical protein [Lachnospiraceae bacterium]MDY2938928.1 hypothetical protein [Fusicatenibacter sp.]
MYHLLFDEIQKLDCLEAVLNGYLRKDNMDVMEFFLSRRRFTSDMKQGIILPAFPHNNSKSKTLKNRLMDLEETI